MPLPQRARNDAVFESSRARLLALQDRAALVAEQTLSIDLRGYEVGATSVALDALCYRADAIVRSALLVLDEAARVAGEAIEHGEPLEGPQSPRLGLDLEAASRRGFSVALERTLGSSANLSAVNEVAFVSQLALSSFRGLVTHRDTEPIAVLSRCGAALGHVRKALAALDEAIARAEGVPRKTNSRAELGAALEIRRAYSILRRRILRGGDPGAETLVPRFRTAGTLIAMLIGWDAYRSMRQGDRLLFRRFQTRILSWLATETRDLRSGPELWTDLSCFLQMLTAINRRQELVDHDRTFVLELGRRGVGASDAATLQSELREIVGLDDELDDLLELEVPPEREQFLPVIEGLCRRFAVRAVTFE